MPSLHDTSPSSVLTNALENLNAYKAQVLRGISDAEAGIPKLQAELPVIEKKILEIQGALALLSGPAPLSE